MSHIEIHRVTDRMSADFHQCMAPYFSNREFFLYSFVLVVSLLKCFPSVYGPHILVTVSSSYIRLCWLFHC